MEFVMQTPQTHLPSAQKPQIHQIHKQQRVYTLPSVSICLSVTLSHSLRRKC